MRRPTTATPTTTSRSSCLHVGVYTEGGVIEGERPQRRPAVYVELERHEPGQCGVFHRRWARNPALKKKTLWQLQGLELGCEGLEGQCVERQAWLPVASRGGGGRCRERGSAREASTRKENARKASSRKASSPKASARKASAREASSGSELPRRVVPALVCWVAPRRLGRERRPIAGEALVSYSHIILSRSRTPREVGGVRMAPWRCLC